MAAVTNQLYYYDPADLAGAQIPSAAGAGSATVAGSFQKKEGTIFSFLSFYGKDGALRIDLPAVGEYTHTAVMRVNFPYTSGDYMHYLSNDSDQLDFLLKRLNNTSNPSIGPGEIYHYEKQNKTSVGVGLFPQTGIWFLLTVKVKAGVMTVSTLADEGAAGTVITRGTEAPTLQTLIAGTYSIGRPSSQSSRPNEGGPFDLGPVGFFDREITEQEELDLFEATFFPPEELPPSNIQSKVSGIVQIDGTPAKRTVRAFGYSETAHTVDGDTVTLSKSLGRATSDPTTGEYTIDLLKGYDSQVFVVAFDAYGDVFTPELALNVGDRIHPTTPNGHVFECTGAGTLPAAEPSWIVDTETGRLYGTASMIAVPFYRPMVHGPVTPEVTILDPAP